MAETLTYENTQEVPSRSRYHDITETRYFMSLIKLRKLVLELRSDHSLSSVPSKEKQQVRKEEQQQKQHNQRET